MNGLIQIQEKQIIKTVTSISVEVPYLILNTKALVRVTMYDISGNSVNQETFELIKPEYDTWLQDDTLVNYVCQKYELQLANSS